MNARRKRVKKNKKEKQDVLKDQPRPLFFKRPDSEKLFGISPRTLEELAMKKKGPEYSKPGKYAIYCVETFVDWIKEHTIKTSK